MRRQTSALLAFLCVILWSISLHAQNGVCTVQNTICTVAGGGPNNLPAKDASIGNAFGIAHDGSGNLYVSTYISGGSRLFKIDATTHDLTVVAGNGTFGFSGDNGPATSAALNGPTRLAVDGSGNIFFADYFNNRVREVIAATGVIVTVAGGGTSPITCPGSTNSIGDGCAGTQAQLSHPRGVAVDGLGGVYIADTGNNVIREVVAGVIMTVAGNGTAGLSGDNGPAKNAQLNFPESVAVDSSGNVYIADDSNARIREILVATHMIITVAGSTPGFSGDGGPATGAQLYSPTGVSVDGSGNIYITDYYSNCIREVFAATRVIQTVAGTCSTTGSTGGFTGDGGLATGAQLHGPYTVSVDASGSFIDFADSINNRIREVTVATGVINTVAGNGTQGFSGEGVSATSAQLSTPSGVFVDTLGNIYIADANNERVREVEASTGRIITAAGNDTAGFSPPGDGGLATSAKLNFPSGVALDSQGNAYIADTVNERIREVVATTGDIDTFAGNGTAGFLGDNGPATSAEVRDPAGLAIDRSGNIFIADTDNQRIREVVFSTGAIKTVAGTGGGGFSGDGGLATSATLTFPYGVAVDGSENFFVTGNDRIREVLAATGVIQTVAGNGTPGFSGDGGPAVNAQLNDPRGVFVDTLGDIFIADYGNNRIREVLGATRVIQTVAGNGTPGFSGDGGLATNAQLFQPTGVAGDRNGNLYVADSNSNRIRMVAGVVAKVNVQAQVMPPSPNCFVMADGSTGCYVLPGSMQQFAAAVTGAIDTSVTWKASAGSISAGGLYTAPANVPNSTTVTVTATSNADSTKSGTATVLIPTPPTITPNPTNVSLTVGQTPPSVDVAMNFDGGVGDAGVVFNSFSCAVTLVSGPAIGTPTCSISSPAVNLNGSGTGNIHVTVAVGPCPASFIVPRSDRPRVPPLTGLLPLLLALMLFGLGFRQGRARQSAPGGLALLLLIALIMLSVDACTGGHSTPTATSSNYEVTVTATSNSVMPPLRATSKSLGVTVISCSGTFHP